MSIRMRMTFAVMLLIAAMACGKSSSPTSPTPTTVSATIVSGGYAPNPINISVGSSVTWMNNDTVAHSVVADGGSFSSGAIAPGGQYRYAFPSAGTFTYPAGANPSMVGLVNVSCPS